MIYTIIFEYDVGGTDRLNINARSEYEARKLFAARYDGRRALRVLWSARA